MADQSNEAVIPNGEEIVERFGGIRPMAAKLEVPVTTVQGWKKRDAIPLSRRDDIVTAASQYNINLKGLISDTANQNARGLSGALPEDPALRASAPTPAQQPVHTALPPRNTNSNSGHDSSVDLRTLRTTARTTSLITSGSLIAIIALAGLALFGGDQSRQNNQLNSLQTRVNSLEAQAPAPSGLPSGLDATISDLQGQVQSITRAIGATGQDLAATGATLVARLNALEQQMLASGTSNAGLQGALDQMQTMAASPEGSGEWQAAIEQLRSVVTGLQGRMDGLDVALAEAKSQNEALSSTLGNVTGRDLSAAAMLLALTQLRTAVDRQEPFADDLTLLREVAQNADPELGASIDRLAPYAESGVLSPDGLKTELQGLSNDIITAKLQGEDVAFKDRAMARLQGLFTIKKDGVPVTGGPERELIARANAQLDANDVAGAIATLQQLEGPAAQAAAPWQNQAAATLAVQAIDQQLVMSLLNKIKGLATSAGAGSSTGVTSNAGPINLDSYPAPAQEPQMEIPQMNLQPEPQQTQPTAPSPVIIQQ